ncbi:UAA transporter family-domain-containing protein [Rhodotorula diobovata]|uniref:UAA transporter family-domain-containing protein n=1 Tax=Rhodotorula diobovata TaxID=5288 RepID=A0A5C5FTT2_9BASI|nr:UAA transporter family-domain-containing protein [Rhodotorula diobovata]
MEGVAKRFSLLLHAAGLICIYSLYGVLQEKIMKSSTYGASRGGPGWTGPHAPPSRREDVARVCSSYELSSKLTTDWPCAGPDNRHFTSSSLLIVFNRVFSVVVGLGILAYKTRRQPEFGSFSQRLKPASPYFAYASVAVFNFLSTSCQYQALRYVSYTTQSLAKTSKMVPVLVVGALVWKKKHMTREWVAGGVILAGCATYLFSTPPVPHGRHAAVATDDESFWNGLIGTFFLLGYLFFDGLVSTTQERVFGKNPSSSDPFGPESPVLDQMVWTNIFAFLIAMAASVASSATGSFRPNLELLFSDLNLFTDACVFSAASALGLIVLLNTIASFGALTSSLIMTIRQFLSILLNAGIFGNFASVSLVGWTGVFWVASGIWIKINRKYDPPKPSKVVFDAEENKGMLDQGASGSNTPILGGDFNRDQERTHKMKQIVMQYGVPVAIPVVLALALAPFMAATVATSTSLAPIASTDAPARVNDLAKVPANAVVDDSAFRPVAPAMPPVVGSTTSDSSDEAILNSAEATEAAELAVAIDGGSWDAQLLDAISPACKSEIQTRPYDTKLRTGFVSYPRSGNSYLRSLIERATGYQTSSIYCDKGLQRTFLGECDHKSNFFIKSHFPALPKVISPDDKRFADFYRSYDQVVHVVRNPLDAISSWWHLSHSPRTAEGFQDHEHKVELPGGKFGRAQRDDVLDLARRWRRHTVYWQQAPVLTHTLRYEDLKAQPIPNMMSLLSFLLPDDALPPLGDIACIAEHHENLQAYHSRRSSDFAQWDAFEPELRTEVLDIVRRPFCAFGYERVLLNARADDPDAVAAMDGFCDVGLSSDDYDESKDSWDAGERRRTR